MTLRFWNGKLVVVGPPRFLLNATSGLMRFYPAFLKASMLLQRLVQ